MCNERERDDIDQAHSQRMDRKYGPIRHIYDITRKYFLFGRDQAIQDLQPNSRKTILEIGCGTGRNLRRMAAQAPYTVLCGGDISMQMLKTAGERTKGLRNVSLGQLDAMSMRTEKTFGIDEFDAVLLSYSLSMMPNWRIALSNAIDRTARGGRLVVIDFGDFSGFGKLKNEIIRQLGEHDAPPILDLEDEVMHLLKRRKDVQGRVSNHLSGYYRKVVIDRL